MAIKTLSPEQIARYRADGYLVVNDVFTPEAIDTAVADALAWQQSFLAGMSEKERAWYVDGSTAVPQQLRKLDNPVAERAPFRRLALELSGVVAGVFGEPGVCFFSQLFFKPPQGGGPKPIHQDNFYFGPRDQDKMITCWIALDEATVENGCLHYWKGSHRGGMAEHFAPKDEPFNLQIDLAKTGERFEKVPAPVARGGVAFHHGLTYHQSANNLSKRYRRAMAVHCMAASNALVNPAMAYDEKFFVPLRAVAAALA